MQVVSKGRPSPILRCIEGVCLFTEDMLWKVEWAKLFATGPEDLVHDQHKFFCMICCVKVVMRAKGAYEIKRHYQSANHLICDMFLTCWIL